MFVCRLLPCVVVVSAIRFSIAAFFFYFCLEFIRESSLLSYLLAILAEGFGSFLLLDILIDGVLVSLHFLFRDLDFWFEVDALTRFDFALTCSFL